MAKLAFLPGSCTKIQCLEMPSSPSEPPGVRDDSRELEARDSRAEPPAAPASEADGEAEVGARAGKSAMSKTKRRGNELRKRSTRTA